MAVTLSSQNQQLVVGEVGGPAAYITLHLTLGGPTLAALADTIYTASVKWF